MSQWKTICSENDLTPNAGVCALVDGEQVAVFYCGKTKAVYAVSNYDPIGNAYVLSRGIIGSLGDVPVVASPLYKQHFNLQTGECLEEPEHTLKTYPIRIEAGEVQLQAA
ncbi:nitrite reductase small subunit NirD [Pseudomaricurvus sp.]|uniref:nitrite reductase small subunit NirD n=1 Tax=Pseudomaricurvus sp. TaxID=2004510 RepID=UPI003F6B5219